MRRVARAALVGSLLSFTACVSDADDGSTGEFGDELGTGDTGTSSADTSGESSTSTGDTSTSTSTTDSSTSASDTTSTTDTTTGDPGNPYDAAAQHCVDTINMYRATLNLPPYERWVEAEECSSGEAESDSISGNPHGAFGTCGEWAQNECPGWPGPPEQLLDGCLAQMWAEGPGEPFSEHGHYINMSSTQYTKVACGFFQTGQGNYWAVQNFQ